MYRYTVVAGYQSKFALILRLSQINLDGFSYHTRTDSDDGDDGDDFNNDDGDDETNEDEDSDTRSSNTGSNGIAMSLVLVVMASITAIMIHFSEASIV